MAGSDSIDAQPARRSTSTIREKVKDKYPDFDENKHSVFVNGQKVDRNQLGGVSTFIDIITIKEKT